MVRKAIILAERPAALLPLANRPLIVHVLDALAHAGIAESTVVADSSVRACIERLLQHQSRSHAVQFAEPASDLPCTLANLAGFINAEPFLLHRGDSLCRASLGTALKARPSPLDTTVLVQETDERRAVVELAPRQLNGGTNVPRCHVDEAPAGAWVLGGGVPQAAAVVSGSGNWELELTALIRHLLSIGGCVGQRQVSDWWRYRNRSGALLEGNRFALEGLSGQPVEADVVDTRIQGVVSIDPSASLKASIVRGPAIIGARVKLHDAYVGPYTSVADDVCVEGAEVEHSIVLPGASISHLGGRIEASVIGPNARIFRDFRLPKALRLNVGEGAEVSLA